MSNILKKDILNIMEEAYKTEEFEYNDSYEDDLEDEIIADYDDIEEIEESIRYSADMIPVIYNEGEYYVEYDQLHKLMECSCDNPDNCTCCSTTDIADALDLIIKANKFEDPNLQDMTLTDMTISDKKDIIGMTMENTYVIIESDDYMREVISELKSDLKDSSSKNKKNKKNKLNAAKDAIKTLTDKGIKIKKKKSKKKK